jgi:hypothetical protein
MGERGVAPSPDGTYVQTGGDSFASQQVSEMEETLYIVQ